MSDWFSRTTAPPITLEPTDDVAGARLGPARDADAGDALAEQARGGEVDRRADLYSIGVLAWETLTGRLPYNAGDALSMALKHVQDPIPRLPAPLKHWQGFIDKSMAKLD